MMKRMICWQIYWIALTVFRWFHPAAFFECLCQQIFDLSVDTSEFIFCPFFDELHNLRVYSQNKWFLFSHNNLLFAFVKIFVQIVGASNNNEI